MPWTIEGKTVVVTGATSGIGKATATELAIRGARVLAVGRDRTTAEGAVEQIRADSGSGSVEPLYADLAKSEAVHKLIATIRARREGVDVLVNNAGVALFEPESTRGLGSMLAVNHLAPFMLTTGILPILRRHHEARVINVTSDQHKKVKDIDWTSLNEQNLHADSRLTYDQTKLMNIWFTRSLAMRLRGSSVNVFAASPGFVKTKLGRHAKGGFGFFLRHVAPLFQSSPAKGAQTSVFACCAPELSDQSGAYLSGAKVAALTGIANDLGQAERLWRLTEDIVGRSAKIKGTWPVEGSP